MKISTRTLTIVLLITTFSLTSNFIFAQYIKIFDFSGLGDGSYPNGSLIYDGTFLYGTTNSGGTNSMGTLFKIMPDGTGYSKLLDFTGNVNGKNPNSSLFTDGMFLYGTTTSGGTNNLGTIFKIMPDGTGYSKLFDFTNSLGSNPYGSLISDGTFLYGTAANGGMGSGVLFKIMSDGTGYSKVLDFQAGIDGSSPTGSVIFDGTFLYGMTPNGGITNAGILFKIKPDGTGYSKLFNFINPVNLWGPRGSLISDGTFLYGMSSHSGTNNMGILFKIKPDGTGYVTLLDFAGTANGSYPNGSLIFDGTFLYGMTAEGGTNNMGILFKIKPDGTGYAALLDFDGTTNGSSPNGSLFSDGTFLYGMTSQGGSANHGTVFKYQFNPVGIKEIQINNQLTIYPNPSSSNFTVRSSINGIYSITNQLGQTLQSFELNTANKYTTNIENLSNGLYFIVGMNHNKITRQKVVITK